MKALSITDTAAPAAGFMAGLFFLRDSLLLRDLGTSLPLTFVALRLIVLTAVVMRKKSARRVDSAVSRSTKR